MSEPALPARFTAARPFDQLGWRGAYTATDAWRGAAVTLLVTRGTDEAVRARFERAYRFLSLADAPWLARALDWGVLDDGRAWFSASAVSPLALGAGPIEAATVREVAVAGVRALLEAHRYGLLHRFVFPGAFVRHADGQLGLGYWTFNGLIAEPDGLVTGVRPYLAPEALDGAPTPSSDHYALGATLWALATGRPPFEGLEGARLADAQASGPAPVASVRPELDPALADVIDRLLAADPRARFPDGFAILRALGEPLVPSINSLAIDHERPLERLMNAYESYRARSGGALVLTGPSGVGKRMLLRQFAAESALRGAVVVPAEAEGPLDRLGALEAWLDRRGVPAPSPDVIENASPAARQLMRRVAMVRRMAAASVERDVVFVFEDLGAHEEEMLARLERLLTDHGAHVMVVASVRGAEAASGKVLARLKRHPIVREVPLEPFSEPAARALVASALGAGALGVAAVREAVMAAAGNPYMLLETLRALVDAGTIALGPSGWAPGDASAWPVAPSLDAALASRLERLSPLARRVGAVIALMHPGAPSRALVASALDEPVSPDMSGAFQDLVAERWLSREPGGYRVAHALLRPVLARALGPEDQRAVHRRVAALLAALDATDPAIASHLAAAGDTAAACQAYERLGERAEASGDALAAFEARQEAHRLAETPEARRRLAELLLRSGASIAPAYTVALLEAQDPATDGLGATERVQRLVRLAACQLLLSRYDEAHELVATGLAEVPDDAPWLAGVLMVYRGLIELHRGCIGPAREAAAEGLARLEAVDPRTLAPNEAAAWRVARFSAASTSRMVPQALGEPNRLEDAEAIAPLAEAAGAPHLAVWPYLTTAQGLAEEGALELARAALACALALLDRAGDVPASRALALAVEAQIDVRAGEIDQALRSATAAVAFARGNAPEPYPLGLALVALAEAQLASGASGDAEASAVEALHLNEAGTHLVIGRARLVLAEATLRRRPELARRQLETLAASASAPGTTNRFYQVAAWRLLGEAIALAGRPREGLALLHRAADEMALLGWHHPLALALLATGRVLKARRAFGRMQRTAMRAASVASAHGYAELKRQARGLGQFGINSFAPLAELRRLMAHADGRDAVVAHGLTLARGLARADRAAVYLVEALGVTLEGALPPGVDPLASAHDMLLDVVRHGHTVWREGVVANQAGDWLVDADVRSLAAVPLVSAAGTVGVLYLDRRTAHEPFTRGEVAKLESLGSYLAIALDQVRRTGAPQAPAEDRQARLESAFGEMLTSDRERRNLLTAMSADLRHQLAELRAGLDEGHLVEPDVLAAALGHAEHLAALIEKSLKE